MTPPVVRGPVVTIDGPAGSGKSSTARAVADRLGFRHLDSGALYRALTYALLNDGRDPGSWDSLTEVELSSLPVDVMAVDGGFEIRVGDRKVSDELRTERVTEAVSTLAGLPAVRAALLGLQRLAGHAGQLVADGRDMGTVVFPDAEVKVFLSADLIERARRRLLERGGTAADPNLLAREAEAIALRDRRDSERKISPLQRPDDAVCIDTTHLDFDAQVDAVVALVRR